MNTTAVGLVVLGMILPARVRLRWIALGAAGLVIRPDLALGLVLVGWVISRNRTSTSGARAVRSSHVLRLRSPRPVVEDQIRCAHLMIVGLSAGLAMQQALELCADHGPEGVRRELEQVLRTAQRSGFDTAFAGVSIGLARLLGAIAGADRTGMPLLHIVAATAEELRRDRMAEATAWARRLPAQLAGPLALGVLPGFVLIVMGPTILAIVERMILRPL